MTAAEINDHAVYVQRLVEASLGTGGPLEGDMDDLTLEAEMVAYEALKPDGDPEFQVDYVQLREALAAVIGEALFQSTVAYLTAAYPEHAAA